MLKSIFASKTVWLNTIAFVLFVLALPQFISVIPASWVDYIALVTAVLNGVLRIWFTAQPITQTAVDNAPAVVPAI